MELAIDSLLLDQNETYQSRFAIYIIKTWILWTPVEIECSAGKFQSLQGVPDTPC